MISNAVIGSNIKAARKSKKMTQKELGKLLGIVPIQIYKYESGRVTIPIARLREIAEILNVTLEYIHGEEELKPASTNKRPWVVKVAGNGDHHLIIENDTQVDVIFKAADDNMLPEIRRGYTVFVQKVPLNKMKSGELAAFKYEKDERCIARRIYFHDNEGEQYVILKPNNGESIYIPQNDKNLTFLGKIVKWDKINY